MNTELEQTDVADLVASYIETAFVFLDRGEIGVARAALRRAAEWTLLLERTEEY